MDENWFDQNQADFYGVPVEKIKEMTQGQRQEPPKEQKPAKKRILVKKDGKLTSMLVDEDELKEMNTPKFHKPGKSDPFKEYKSGTFGSDIRNTIFGNK